MGVRIREFASVQELEDFINARIVGNKVLYPTVNVRGLTTVFSTPNKTVTFPDTVAYETATPNAIASYMNTEMGTDSISLRQYGQGLGGKDARLALVKDADVLVSGTALSVLGLGAGTVGTGKIVASKIVQIFISSPARYGICYEE